MLRVGKQYGESPSQNIIRQNIQNCIYDGGARGSSLLVNEIFNGIFVQLLNNAEKQISGKVQFRVMFIISLSPPLRFVKIYFDAA